MVVTRRSEFESPDHELIWLSFLVQKRYVFLCSAYRPPSSDTSLFPLLSSSVDLILSRHNAAEIILLGDFNCHHVTWLNSSSTDNFGETMFSELIVGQGLTQLVKEPTRHATNSASSLLDLLLTNSPGLHDVKVSVPLGTSDHSVVTSLIKGSIVPTIKKGHRQIFLYSKADWNGLKGYFRKFAWKKLLHNLSADEACTLITKAITDGVQRFVPSKRVKNKHTSCPWFNEECSASFKAKDKAFKNMQTYASIANKAEYHACKYRYHQVIRDAKSSYASELEDRLNSCNNKDWWKLFKNALPHSSKSAIPHLKVNNSILADSTEKAEAFNAFFASQSNFDTSASVPPNVSANPDYELSTVLINRNIVLRVLKSLNVSKATGPDGISPLVLRECASQLAFPLSRLYKLSLTSGNFPSLWKFANVTPVHKKDAKCELTNYRPISILPVMSKVMEMIVNEQLRIYLEHNNLLCPTQYGFRKSRSTVDVLSYLSQKWQNTLDAGNEVVAVTLDISKAFDRVWHNGLLVKLKSFGISGCLYNWIANFLSCRSQSVVIDGCTSSKLFVNAGVPQGSVLGPTLFLLFIDDLRGNLHNSIHLFADDATIDAQVDTSKSVVSVCNSLQEDLNRIEAWAKRWCVVFNPSKV